MDKITIIDGNSSDKDNTRVFMVKGEKGDKGDTGEKGQDGAYSKTSELINDSGFLNETEVEAIVDEKIQDLGLFPVGSLFFTAVNTNPSTFMGGTWQRVAEGLFLVGVGKGTDTNGVQRDFVAGANDGEYEHIQTVGELATHNHTVTDEGHTHNVTYKDGTSATASWTPSRTVFNDGGSSSIATDSATTGITIDNAGLNQGMNTVNPSFAMYVWQRTA